MYVIIGVWRRRRPGLCGFKFFLYTLAGSLLFLVGVIVLYFHGGETFDILALTAQDLPRPVQSWLFFAFLVAFAVKVRWSRSIPGCRTPRSRSDGGSIILAGVLLKMEPTGLAVLADAAWSCTIRR